MPSIFIMMSTDFRFNPLSWFSEGEVNAAEFHLGVRDRLEFGRPYKWSCCRGIKQERWSRHRRSLAHLSHEFKVSRKRTQQAARVMEDGTWAVLEGVR